MIRVRTKYKRYCLGFGAEAWSSVSVVLSAGADKDESAGWAWPLAGTVWAAVGTAEITSKNMISPPQKKFGYNFVTEE